MKPVLVLAAAAAILSTAPALADNGQVFDHAAQLAAYSNTLPRDNAKQCFNGQFISGVNRSGPNTLYVQSPKRGIYRLRLAGDCSALDGAQKLTVRSNGSDLICPGEAAETVGGVAKVHLGWIDAAVRVPATGVDTFPQAGARDRAGGRVRWRHRYAGRREHRGHQRSDYPLHALPPETPEG